MKLKLKLKKFFNFTEESIGLDSDFMYVIGAFASIIAGFILALTYDFFWFTLIALFGYLIGLLLHLRRNRLAFGMGALG